eukprot:6214570-Pleurochrysis_carterae.AAC.5
MVHASAVRLSAWISKFYLFDKATETATLYPKDTSYMQAENFNIARLLIFHCPSSYFSRRSSLV